MKNTNALTAAKILRKKTICVCRPPDNYHGSKDYFEAMGCLKPTGFDVLQYYLKKVSLTVMTKEKKACVEDTNISPKSYSNSLDNLFEKGYIRAINEDTYLLDYKAGMEVTKVG